jgi:hypothetical protein
VLGVRVSLLLLTLLPLAGVLVVLPRRSRTRVQA